MQRDDADSNSAMRFAVRIAVALVFAGTGLEKFGSDAHWLRVFGDIGLGDWFRYFTGVVETAGGLLFLIPAATTVGAALLVSAMVGAMAVHIFIFKHPADSLFPGVYLVGVLLAYAKLRVTKKASTR
jgi:uncharacterized membrane protein YphA (DoxX/SURF4 family)